MAKKTPTNRAARRVSLSIQNFEMSGDRNGNFLDTDDIVDVTNFNINSVKVYTAPVTGADDNGGPSYVWVQINEGIHIPINAISRFPPSPDGYLTQATSFYTDLGSGNKRWDFANFYAQGWDPAEDATVIAWAQYNKSSETIMRFTYRWFYLFSTFNFKEGRKKGKY